MKLTTLEYFVEVATEGSFTKASQKLYVSQPTLSRRIQELENELGVELFVRNSHSLSLSNEGEQFLTETMQVLKRVDHFAHLFDQQNEQKQLSQLIKIGYLPNFNLGKMYQLIDQFKAQYPNVRFLVKQDTPMQLVDGLTSGRYDLVFNLATYFQQDNAIQQLTFMKNHLQVALPLKHLLSTKKILTFADLNQESVILLERKQSPIIVDYVVNQFLRYGFNVKATSYVKDLDEGLARVSLGEGLAFLYSGMNDGSLEKKYPIKIIDLETADNDQDLVAAIQEKNEQVYLQKFSSFLKENLIE
ncbi:LysR family transcriptional regulator [Enterococcus devriesei]|uniref:LysR family transcriptional regulator n=1 Tax=Enterococcus devriesei TaxID=319970 RepID=UPI001C0FDC01|nr:LysR family transcriptional regulator [Enterococcus devriesei]MBU5365779.1 LysR family transcriptional regulator [Enterococcus devriesei]MDT2821929.1 LysR family transcriptional regulator [Enterococcus devriesei]